MWKKAVFIGIRVSKRNDVMLGMLVTGWSLCKDEIWGTSNGKLNDDIAIIL